MQYGHRGYGHLGHRALKCGTHYGADGRLWIDQQVEAGLQERMVEEVEVAAVAEVAEAAGLAVTWMGLQMWSR